MKKLLILITIMLVGGCASTIPTMKSVAYRRWLSKKTTGEYEWKDKNGITFKQVLLDNGVCELLENGHKIRQPEWSISNGELHVNHGHILVVWRINADKSITWIAKIIKGKREPKGQQETWKKIK